MKILAKFFQIIFMLSLVLVLIKPTLFMEMNSSPSKSAQYSIHHECSSRTSVISSSCQLSAWYLQEEQASAQLYSFLFLGLLIFILFQFKYRSPIESIDKPPIFPF
ncbi:hypothetical protein [Legionella israelensis]|uniref:Uncharacterized protein n=2 Tax=Legionella israelensis TaxID=454 RepID=A0A0W0W3H6_9GAMM|nr:hypothetical protein [Legionella israelensis]KTD26933.1 hypothetical protein Lisr_1144 [Legionella israelensis]QBS08595.1 hypothetical protein E4T55_01205 [Legionella israelensis]SCX75637.1 hypothetical protein SAMN02746069_00004 [Legionella israelensis DSM 19235]STX58252.1 Uncharacterised protein [Legionella israelensis]